MTTDQNEMNPPAFAASSEFGRQTGMSLRDWFAGQALPSIIREMQHGTIGPHEIAGYGPAGFAATAYMIADAMLANRKEAADV